MICPECKTNEMVVIARCVNCPAVWPPEPSPWSAKDCVAGFIAVAVWVALVFMLYASIEMGSVARYAPHPPDAVTSARKMR